MSKQVQDWGIDDVQDFLAGLSLDTLKPDFQKNAINGKDLLDLTDDDMKEDLKMTQIQIRKVRNAIQEVAPGAMKQAANSASQTSTRSAAPAPAPAPAAPAAAPQSFAAKGEFQKEDLDQYADLRSKIAHLEGKQVETGASTARQWVQQLSSRLATAQKRVQQLDEAKAEAEKKLEKLDGWYPGKFIMGQKNREEKHEKRQKALDEAKAADAKIREEVASLQKQLANAQSDTNSLTAQVQELNNARSTLSSLMARVFSDPVWASDPTIQSLNAAINDFDRRAAEASSHAGTYTRGRNYLRSAREKIAQAMNALQRTRMMNMMGMGMNLATPGRHRGGFGMDMMEMMIIQQANELIKNAAADFLMARQLLPALPYKEEGSVKAAQMGVFVAILSPGIMGDVAQNILIRKSMGTVHEFERGVAECLEWAQRNLDAFSSEGSQMSAGANGKRAEIIAYQHQQLSAAVAKNG